MQLNVTGPAGTFGLAFYQPPDGVHTIGKNCLEMERAVVKRGQVVFSQAIHDERGAPVSPGVRRTIAGKHDDAGPGHDSVEPAALALLQVQQTDAIEETGVGRTKIVVRE